MEQRIHDWLAAEKTGNKGRAEWNSRPQTSVDAQAMLAGAIKTIERLLAVLEKEANHG